MHREQTPYSTLDRSELTIRSYVILGTKGPGAGNHLLLLHRLLNQTLNGAW